MEVLEGMRGGDGGEKEGFMQGIDYRLIPNALFLYMLNEKYSFVTNGL